MPRRFFPRGALVMTGGRPIPQFERFCRDLLEVPEWVRATERRTLAAALADTIIATASPEQQTLYQISYYARIVQPATTSSSLTITVTWTDGGVTQTFTGPAITGNTTDSAQSRTNILVTADPGTAVKVSTSYSSTGAEAMAYDLEVAREDALPRKPTVAA